MPSFNSLLKQPVTNEDLPFEYSTPQKQTNYLGKVFGILFFSMLATALLSCGLMLGMKLLISEITDFQYACLILLFISGIGLLVMAFVLPNAFMRQKRSIIPAYVLFIFTMSLVLTCICLEFDLPVVIATFGVSALMFGIMALLGILSKGELNGIVVVIGGIFSGVILLSVVNIFLFNSTISWIVSFLMLALVLFVTILDVNTIKNIIHIGSNKSYNMILFGAFILYMDFIQIFIRLLPYIAKILAESKK